MIISRPATPEYRNNFDRVFQKPTTGTECAYDRHFWCWDAFEDSRECQKCGFKETGEERRARAQGR